MPDSDRYVIVYRDGWVGFRDSREQSDAVLEWHKKSNLGQFAPAYRIRIRERAKPLTPGVDWRGAESVYRPDPFNNLPAPGGGGVRV